MNLNLKLQHDVTHCELRASRDLSAWSSLVRVLALHRVGTKSLPESVMTYRVWDNQEHNKANILSILWWNTTAILISKCWTTLYDLTHWGRVTHICVGNLTIIGSDNGLSPGRRQAIIWTNAGILLIGPLRTNFSEILIEILTYSFKKMCLKVSSAKWRSFCLGFHGLTHLSLVAHAYLHWFVIDKTPSNNMQNKLLKLGCFYKRKKNNSQRYV